LEKVNTFFQKRKSFFFSLLGMAARCVHMLLKKKGDTI